MISNKEIIAEYLKYCELFNDIVCEKLSGIVTDFENENEKVVSERFCSGSDMFLGYYNPSPVFDLVVGNVHRGRLLKRVTKSTKPTHRYGLDNKNRILTMVEIPEQGMKNIDKRAVFFYEKNSVVIVRFGCFKNSTSANVLAQCVYDNKNRLVKYTVGEMTNNQCWFVTQEIYSYTPQGVDTACIWDCFYVSDSMLKEFRNSKEIMDLISDLQRYICRADEYYFYHDDDGYIVKYDAIDKNGESTTYEIAKSKRRKV